MNAVPMKRIDAPRRRPGHRSGRTVRMPMQRRDGYSGVAEAAAVIEQRPQLRVVPKRRLAANAAAIAVVVIGVLMLSAVVLHTRLAERQLEIDRLERQVENEHARFDVLRNHRAELRAPTRLSAAAANLGMMPAIDTRFADVDPYLYAYVLAVTGGIGDEDGALVAYDALDQVRRVRAAEAGIDSDAADNPADDPFDAADVANDVAVTEPAVAGEGTTP